MFEGIVAVASTLYNYGDRKTAEKMMGLVNWTIIEGNLNSLDKTEKNRDSKRVSKIKNKAINKQSRLTKQKQFQTATIFRQDAYVPSSQSAKDVTITNIVV